MKGRKSEKYKHVYSSISKGKHEYWSYWFHYKSNHYSGYGINEREAALKCDLKRIDLGLNPVNILKKI